MSLNSEPIHRWSFFSTSLVGALLPQGYELMPNVGDIFELEFALGEINALDDNAILRRSAFIGKVHGVHTAHYRLGALSAMEIYEKKSIRTRSFFSKGRFSTGYAVHSLFPYRGKFHAQLVKAIINVIGLREGDVLLDPMMGSGTACIEAQLIGIDAVGIDISPFCQLMASAKSQALTVDPSVLDRASVNVKRTCEVLEKHAGDVEWREKFNGYREIILLAYLDAMGYARRVKNQVARDKFPEVLGRYLHTIRQFATVRQDLCLRIGNSRFECADARHLPLEDNSVDGIVTSPPYSFAIDYVENDLPQLEYLGVDIMTLRENLLGLRGGRRKADRIRSYMSDLKVALSEMARVLKPRKYCVIIIGSNEIQTGGIRHEIHLKTIAPECGLTLEKELLKPIRGIQNSMTEEFVLFFRKVA